MIITMQRPYESDMYISALNNTTLEYSTADVLMPDIVTDAMAAIACKAINQERPRDGVSILELGVGAAPFLAQVARGVRGEVPVRLTGVDIDKNAVPFADYNVGRTLAERNNASDEASITVQSWDEILVGTEYFDFIYLNPPYLPVGETVRQEFQKAPFTSMYVPGSVDGLDCYREILPRIQAIMNPGAHLMIRTPRDRERYSKVLRIIEDSFDGVAATHTVEVEAELGQRRGCGFVVEYTNTQQKSFRVAPVRTIGVALMEELVA